MQDQEQEQSQIQLDMDDNNDQVQDNLDRSIVVEEPQQSQQENIERSQQQLKQKQEPKQQTKQIQEPKQQSKQEQEPINHQPYKPVAEREDVVWKTYDFLFPGGRVAKLIKVTESANSRSFPYSDIIYKLKLMDGSPVVNLIGAKDTNRSKFYAGIARACFNTDAIIVDSAISNGIEKHAIRRGLKLVGVAPESEVKYPKLNPTFVDPYEISNGHSHIFLMSNIYIYNQIYNKKDNRDKNYYWGQEATFKINLCQKLAEGKMSRAGIKEKFKVVHVLLGESESFMSEIQQAVQLNQPILVIKGSQICGEYFQNQNRPNGIYTEPTFGALVKRGHFYGVNSVDSEDIAQVLHFFLTVQPY